MWCDILHSGIMCQLSTNFVLIRNLIADHVVVGHQHICITFKFIWYKHQEPVNSWTNIYQHVVFCLTVELKDSRAFT